MPWKRVLGIFAILIAFLLATFYVVLRTYDFDRFKPEIIQEVKKATGRDLRLQGRLELAIGLTPALVVRDVGFQNASWGSRPEMAKIKRLEIQARVFPLLWGEIEVRRLVLIEPDLLIETHKSGRSNLEFIKTRSPGPAAPEKGGGEKGRQILSMLTFNDVRIEKGQLSYKHGPSGRSYAIRVAYLTAGAANMEAPVDLRMKGSYKSIPLEASGSLGPLPLLLDPNKKWPVKITAELAGAVFSVDGAIRDAFRLRDFDLTVTARGSSISNVAKMAGAIKFPLTGPFNGAAKLNDQAGKVAVEDLRLRVGTEEVVAADLSGAIRDLLGKRGIDLNFKVEGKSISSLERLVKRPLPGSGPFKISGRFSSPGPKRYVFSELKALLGETRIEGSVDANLAGTRPSVGATLLSQKMDLRTILSKNEVKGGRASAPAPVAAKKKKVFSEAPLPVERLKKADVHITLQAAEVLLPRLTLKNVDLEMMTKEGWLTVKRWKSIIGGGALEGHLDMLPWGDGLSLSLRLKVRELGVENVLKALNTKEGLEGKLDADIELRGRGRSVASLMADLNGKTVVTAGNGRIKNEYIEFLGAGLATGLFRLINPFKDRGEYTNFKCFVSGFAVKNGLAEITALVLDTDQTTVIVEGKVNLKNEGLDMALKPSPKKGLQTGFFGKLSLSFGELAKPMKLGGTLAEPSLGLDPGLTALAFGKAVGGVLLFGPLGIAAALAGRSSGDENPCVAAIEAAKKGIKVSEDKKAEETKEPAQKPSEQKKGALEGFGSSIKKLFGD